MRFVFLRMTNKFVFTIPTSPFPYLFRHHFAVLPLVFQHFQKYRIFSIVIPLRRRISGHSVRLSGHRLRCLLQCAELTGGAGAQHGRAQQHHLALGGQQHGHLADVGVRSHEQRVLAQTAADV